MTALPDVSIIVPSWNTRALLADCLESIVQTTEQLRVETIVVDNASSDGSASMVQERFPFVRLICNPENTGFARASNQGVAASGGHYVLLLNSDARLLPNALRLMIELAEAQPRAGVVGAQLRNRDGSFQASHMCFPTLRQEFLILSGIGRLVHGRWYPSRGPEDDRGPQPVDWVGGACLLARRAALAEIGGFDEGYFMYAEEMDLCYRMRTAGWEIWYQPAATVIHIGGGSSQQRRTAFEADLYRSLVRFFRTHYGVRAARLLYVQIYVFTALKIPVHGLLHRVSRGRYGRPVPALRSLGMKVRGDQ